MFVWRLQQGHQAVVLIRAATVNPVQWGQVQMLWKQAKDTWRNLLGSASRLTLGDPATILTFIPANVWRASPASDVAAADQTHCRWSVALTAVATAWQRCAFRFGEHNHNKRSWTRGLHFSGTTTTTRGGVGGWGLEPATVFSWSALPQWWWPRQWAHQGLFLMNLLNLTAPNSRPAMTEWKPSL